MIEFVVEELFPHVLAHVIVDVLKTTGKAALLRPHAVSRAAPTERHRQLSDRADGLDNGAFWSSAARTARRDRPKGEHGSPTAPVWSGSSSITLVSLMPGRVRLRMRGLQGDEERAKEVLTKLHDLPGVSEATASVITGNVLVSYTLDRTSLAHIRATVELLSSS